MDKLNMNTVTVQSAVDYATVESRVRAFCLEHQNGQILTEMVKCEDDTGEVVFKAHAVVGGVIRGTGHAMEVRGSSNINKTSHIECAETNAVGRCLAMLGYIGKGQISSYEEIENAKLQREEIKKKERKLEADISSLSIKYKKAIDEKNEVAIEECRQEVYDNPNLSWKEVSELLSEKQRDYIYSLNEKARDEREIKKEMREASIKKSARERRKKYLNG
jgi:hypothetical protein